VGVYAFLLFLVLALLGLILEAIERVRKSSDQPVLTAQLCLQSLIGAVNGQNDKETHQMRKVLEGVLIHGISAEDALSVFALGRIEKVSLWFKATSQFQGSLRNMIEELNRYLDRLLAYL
jgi:uncharacterized tellurite resistance protein B-like protein